MTATTSSVEYPKHPVLIVGGTGMLAGVVREFVRDGHPVAVVARHRQGIMELGRSSVDAALVEPVTCDYADARGLRAALRQVGRKWGPFGLAVCWVHSPHRCSVHEALNGFLSEDATVIDVLGSGAADQDRSGGTGERPEPFRSLRLSYRRVILGFTDGVAGTRWLTHEEISSGVLSAVQNPLPTCIVGRVHPRSDRP